MRKNLLFLAALMLAGPFSKASEETDTLTSKPAKFFSKVKVGPQEYILPPIQKVDSVLIKKLAIDESFRNRKNQETTVTYLTNLQRLNRQLAGLETFPDYSGNIETLLTYLNSSKFAGDGRSQLLLQNSIAHYYINKGELDKAGSYLNESLQIKQLLGDKPGTAILLGGLAEISKLNGQYEEAGYYNQLILNTSLSAGKNIPIASAYLNQSALKMLQQDYKEAERLVLRKALPIFRGNKLGRLSCFVQLAAIYYQEKRYSESKWYCLQAKNLATLTNDTEAMVGCLARLANIKNAEGDFKNALLDFKSAETLATVNHYTERLIGIKGDMGEIYRSMGNYAAAGSFIDESSQLSKSFLAAPR